MSMEPAREFPSASEWLAIFEASPFPALLELTRDCGPRPLLGARSVIEGLGRDVALSRLDVEVHNRVVDVAKSYVFMKYYESLGIPDERWYISPGRTGHSIEYFPDFQDHHFMIKSWFDYYADTFYQKLFAAWAVTGHVLNETFALGLKPRGIDFGPAVRALGPDATELKAALLGVIEHAAFDRARSLRNDITHNESPSAVGMAISKFETPKSVTYTMGVKSYVPSAVILENASECVVLLRQTIGAICPPRT